MKISVVGLGYVGTVCSACFAKEGHEVIGVDVEAVKIDLINQGKAPIVEKDLDRYIREGVEAGRLRATGDLKEAIEGSEITFIAVGTPSEESGNIDLNYIREASREIGEVLKEKEGFHIVAMRSTVLPGTAHNVVIPTIEEHSGKRVGEDFGYVSNPEFLRESTAIYDFYHPPKTVIGPSDERTAEVFETLYSFLEAPFFKTDTIEVAEMVKYSDNAWHAVKVTFANEIGIICKKLGIDSHKVMDIFCADTKLNISPYYLKPGFAFGGSCLPKDVRAISYEAHSLAVSTPLLDSLLESNEKQIERIYEEFVKPSTVKKIGILGLSFKKDTDDLRESPVLKLVEELLEKGYDVNIYDRNVVAAKREGANSAFLEKVIPHIDRRLSDDLEKVISESELLIIGNPSDEFREIEKRYPEKTFIDLVRISEAQSGGNYIGIAW